MMPTIPETNGHDSWSNPGTSRAINVSIDRPEVEALCEKHKTSISAIETLPKGGTRVVLTNGDDAAVMRRVFGNRILAGNVERAHWARVLR